MNVEAVLPPLKVNPKQDSQDNARRDQRREGQAQHRDKDGKENASQPLLNTYGQVIGKTINITA